LGEIPAAGKSMKINGLILDRVIDDRVIERWELWD
jgi:predicted ester cyclase